MRRTTEDDLPFSISPADIVIATFTDDGTPSGNSSITADYSVTPQEFFFQVPPGKVFYGTTLDVFIQGSGNVTANGYGPTLALPTGISLSLRKVDDAAFTPDIISKTTGSWSAIPGTALSIVEAGPGDNYLNVQWNFSAAIGTKWRLGPGERAVAVASDDLTALTEHRVTISGFFAGDP